MKKLLFILCLFAFKSYSQTTIQQQQGGNTQLNTLLPSQTGNNGKVLQTNGSAVSWQTVAGGGGSMVYPGAGIALSTGSAWGTSITDNSTNWNTAFSQSRQWDGGSTGLTAATGRTSLGGTTVGQNLFTLTNPSAIRFLRLNADNTVSSRTAAEMLSDIGAAASSHNHTVSNITDFPTTTAGFSNSTNKNFVTDAQLTVIGNTSGTNTGDNATNSLYNGKTVPAGGTTGQVLAKASNTDHDLQWTSAGGGSSTTTTDNLFNISSNVLTAKKTVQTLTDGSTVTWDASSGYNARLTLGGNRTLEITNPQEGDYYTITVIQDGTGGRTLALPNGQSAVLSTAANDSTTLTAYYRNNAYEWRSSYSMAYGYSIKIQALTSSPADGATAYFGMLPKAPTTTSNISKVYIRKAGTIKMAEIYCYSGTAGTGESWSLYVRKNNTTDYLIATVAAAASERVFSNTGLAITVAAGDYIEIKSVQPTWATNPSTTIYGGYIYIE